MISFADFITESVLNVPMKYLAYPGKKFIPGEYYFESNVKGKPLKYKVLKRTDKSVTIVDDYGDKTTRKINKELSNIYKCECLYPEGEYTMAPMLKAKDIILQNKEE